MLKSSQQETKEGQEAGKKQSRVPENNKANDEQVWEMSHFHFPPSGSTAVIVS